MKAKQPFHTPTREIIRDMENTKCATTRSVYRQILGDRIDRAYSDNCKKPALEDLK